MGESPLGSQAERDEIRVSRTVAWAGGTHGAGSESPLGDQSDSCWLGLKILYVHDHSGSQQSAQGLLLPVCNFCQQSSWGLLVLQSGSQPQ